MRAIQIAVLVCATAAPLQAQDTARQESAGPFEKAVVAADHPLASQAGLEMLEAGGNVVDAAVATSFALSVVRPASCGVGGGGFMVIWDAKLRRAVALDYRERAPMAATADMFREPVPEGHETASMRGPLAVGVPGTVAGLCYAAERYGTLPLSKLLQPAIRLAEQGIPIDRNDRGNVASTLRKLNRFDGYRQRYRLLLEGYLNSGDPITDETRFRSPQLPVLRKIAAEGRKGFYSGEVAAAIVDACSDGGIITKADLARMQPVQRKPLRGSFDGHDVITMPPPSSGGVAVLQMLNTLQAWERLHPEQRFTEADTTDPSLYAQVLTEAMKHAFADRAEFLGDTDFAEVPLKRLLSKRYAEDIARRIRADRTGPPESYGRFFAAPDAGTSHFSVIDAQGNAVACTETINLGYGSFVVVPGYGIVLNDEMDDFAARPGEPNAFGLIQSEANAVAAGKKPLSSMTPTIVVRNGKAIAAMGGSGGPKIITATLQVLLNQIRFGQLPQDAVNRPRLHHQWSPNRLLLEADLHRHLGTTLTRKGHATQVTGGVGVAQSVGLIDGSLYGGSDPRKGGRPAGH